MNIPLLHRLRGSAGALPIAALGPDPLATRRDLDELAAFGFGLELAPDGSAVTYLGPSPRLCPDQIEWELGTRIVGRRVAVWDRVGSTNDLAAQAATSRANEGLAILAEEQTVGRGSRGRTWTAPPRSAILLSVLLFPPGPLADVGWLTSLGAVAVVDMLRVDHGLDAEIKWPNDVRYRGQKLAGVLVERSRGTVVGIGLNVTTTTEDFPPELRESATSLRRLLGPVDRSEVARSLLQSLDRWLDRSMTAGPDALAPAYRRFSEHRGHDVNVTTPAGIVAGHLEAIDLRAGLTLATTAIRQVLPIAEVLAIENREGSIRDPWCDLDI